MASAKIEKAASSTAYTPQESEEAAGAEREAIESSSGCEARGDETAAPDGDQVPAEAPRTGSLSSLLRRLGDVQADAKAEEAGETHASDGLAEMNDLLLQSESGDDRARERSRDADPAQHKRAAADDAGDGEADGDWGPDGFERSDEADIRPDAELMSLISELNGKLDRTHDVISRAVPKAAPETHAFDPPPSVLERRMLPQRGRLRETLMFTGMWGALFAAIIAVVYSNSWWLSEPPASQDQAPARETAEAPPRSQSLNRLGALGSPALSEPAAPRTPPSGSPSSAAPDAAIEPRRPPRPAAPDEPAASGDSAADVISRALAASDAGELPADFDSEDAPPEPKTAPAAAEPPATPAPAAARPEPDAAADGPRIQEASSVTAVSEWRRVARATAAPKRPAAERAQRGSGFAVARARGRAGQPIPLPIRVPDLTGDTEASIMIRGLPDGSQLSAGEKAGESTWILPASDAADLMFLAPETLQASEIALEVTLVTSDGSVPTTKLLEVELTRAPAVTRPRRPDAVPSSPQAAEAAELLGRGRDLMQIGDIAGARLVLALAAELGSVDAMVALARTYDPVHLAKLHVRGIQADIDKAIAWYRRASEQGDDKSRDRAEALVASLRQ